MPPKPAIHKMKAFPLSEVYRLLEPGPVVMVTTSRGGCNNVMTMAWHTMMEFTPPLIGCVISNIDYSFSAVKATRECVIAVPTVELAKKVVRVGSTTGKKVDKFSTIGLTPVPASKVKAPLIGECFANIECKVVDTVLVSKYNFFILEAVKAWIDPAQKNPQTIHHRGNGVFAVDGQTLRIPFKM